MPKGRGNKKQAKTWATAYCLSCGQKVQAQGFTNTALTSLNVCSKCDPGSPWKRLKK